MASATVAKRRGSAYTARVAAKQRRQKIVAAVLAVGLAALLAYEVPHTLKALGKSSPSQVAAPSASSSAPPTRHATKALRGTGTGADPFAVASLPNGDPAVAAAEGPDPFTGPGASASSPVVASSPPPPALPDQIVIGRPGGGRVATHGWIVILASIPVAGGRDEAVRFASAARPNVGSLSILNSSSRRPLRGGYWVVYTGPYKTLGEVSQRAGNVHGAGYRDAYIRELITYR